MLAVTILSTLASLAAAQRPLGYGPLPSQQSQPSCTLTYTPTSFTCCGDIAGATATSYTNCGSCTLSTASNFPACRCATPPETVATLTSTITACAPRPTDSLPTTTTPANRSKCTKTITEMEPACGDCGHTYATTKTSLTDCQGCRLKTTTVKESGFGICACPTESVTTVTACSKAAPVPYW